MLVRRLSVALGLLGLAAGGALAAEPVWPEKQIHLILPFPPGGSSGVVARVLADKLGSELGQAVVVEARPGADGNLGTEYVARSAPDGYTWLGSGVPFTTQVALHPKSLRYDPQKDFAPVVKFAASTFMVTVPATLPVNTLQDFVAYAKQHGHEMSYAGSSRGSVVHLATEEFKQSAGIAMEMVPYAGQPPAITDLISGRVQFMALGSSFAVPLVQAGKLKALAVLDTKRNPNLPNVPTTVEAGFPDLLFSSWVGLHVPAKTPPAVIAKINAAVNAAMQSPDIKDKFAKADFDVVAPNTPAAFGAEVTRDIAAWAQIVKSAGVQTD